MICSVSFRLIYLSVLFSLCMFLFLCVFFRGLSQLTFSVYPSVFSTIFCSILFSILFCFLFYSVFCFLFLVRAFVGRPLSGRGGCVSATVILCHFSYRPPCYDVDRGTSSCI